MKEEALKLADELLRDNTQLTVESAYMIRRLVERMVELESCLDFALQDTMDYITLNNLGAENNHWLVWARKLLVNTTPQTKPLSDEEIIKVFEGNFNPNSDGTINSEVLAFARAIEERHGIK